MSTQRTATYDPSSTFVIINHKLTGAYALVGFMEDNFINLERDSETFAHTTGADNFSTRVFKANTSAKVTVALQQSSESNDVLSHLYNYDKASRSSKGLFSLTVVDKSGRSYAHSDEAYIAVVPNSPYGSGVSGRDWVFHCTQMEDFIGGNALVSQEVVNIVQALGGTIPADWVA